MEKYILDIDARVGKRGKREVMRFAGSMAADEIEAYKSEMQMTKADMEASKESASASAAAAATSAEKSAASDKSAKTSADSAKESMNSAMQSATSADGSATVAANSATAAGKSASEANLSALQAGTSANNASESAESAATAASNAAQSAETASSAASSATTSADSAKTSASSAAESANSAASSATTAETNANKTTLDSGNAKVYMESALDSKNAAAESASTAVSSATAAKTSETNAASSSTTAVESASSASASAENARTSEKNAASSAETASNSASAAAASAESVKTSEKNAASSATAAASSASAAKTSATNAATSASNAKTSETNAASSATAAAESAKKAYEATPDGRFEEITEKVAKNTAQIETNTKEIATLRAGMDAIIYGFHIDSSEADPEACVTYLTDAVGMTPAHMDFTNDVFDYGSWEDAFFMPRPCMLNQDGTVAYYLDPNDYTKKEDGTDSDVADTTYAGNAMMEWGRDGQKIWLKVVPKGTDSTSADVFISNRQVTDDYHAWSFIDANGAYIDHFYTPIYNGSIVDNVLRSISGQSSCTKTAFKTEITYAGANGTGWSVEQFGVRLLVNYLLILIGKSLDTQGVFGKGLSSGAETAIQNAVTGTLNDKGLFYGSSGAKTAVKVFGMEHWWGNTSRRQIGCVINDGTIRYKLTESNADGTDGGYTVDGANFIDAGAVMTGTSGTCIKNMIFKKDGLMLAHELDGSTTTYYGDSGLCSYTTGIILACGGSASTGDKCGAFQTSINGKSGNTWIYSASALSYTPLAI